MFSNMKKIKYIFLLSVISLAISLWFPGDTRAIANRCILLDNAFGLTLPLKARTDTPTEISVLFSWANNAPLECLNTALRLQLEYKDKSGIWKLLKETTSTALKTPDRVASLDYTTNIKSLSLGDLEDGLEISFRAIVKDNSGSCTGGSCTIDSQQKTVPVELDDSSPPPPDDGRTPGDDSDDGSSDSTSDLPGIDLTIDDVFNIINNFACWLWSVAMILIIIALILVGLRMMNARGKPEEFSKAKINFLHIIVGALVIMGVYVIIATVANAVGVDVSLIPFNCSAGAGDLQEGFLRVMNSALGYMKIFL